MNTESAPQQKVIPSFDLQRHHAKVKLPEEFDLRDIAIKHHVFPLKVIQQRGVKKLLLAMRNTNDQQLIFDIEFRAGMNVLPVYADDIDIQWLIQKHYYGRPLTPTPTHRPKELTHDLFEQLSLVTDTTSQTDWVKENISIPLEKADEIKN